MQKFSFITWNVNSIRARLPLIKQLLIEKSPELCMLQEIKCTEETFPFQDLDELGYKSTIVGQKSYNGVAFLHRSTLNQYSYYLPELSEARYQSTIFGKIKFTNIYMHNGFDMLLSQYQNKLLFLKNLLMKATEDLEHYPCIIGGDFNIIPYTYDTWNNSTHWELTGIASPAVRSYFFKLLDLGYIDLGKNKGFTWRDYKNKKTELRIDHILISKNLENKIIYKTLDYYRDLSRPSVHFPIVCIVNLD